MRMLVAAAGACLALGIPAARADVNVVVACQGGQTPVLTTDVVIRNLTGTALFGVTNVVVFNAAGTQIYTGVPAGLFTRQPAYSTAGFLTRNVLADGNVGPLTIFLTLQFYGATSVSSNQYWVTSTKVDLDGTGRVTTRDTVPCVGGGGP